MNNTFVVKPEDCPSTHGGSGYASGSLRDGNDIICGLCGYRITNALPRGYNEVWVWDDSLLGKLHIKGHYIRKPNYCFQK